MSKEEIEKEYKEILKKTKKQYFSRGIITIFLLLLLLYINKFILLIMMDSFLVLNILCWLEHIRIFMIIVH